MTSNRNICHKYKDLWLEINTITSHYINFNLKPTHIWQKYTWEFHNYVTTNAAIHQLTSKTDSLEKTNNILTRRVFT